MVTILLVTRGGALADALERVLGGADTTFVRVEDEAELTRFCQRFQPDLLIVSDDIDEETAGRLCALGKGYSPSYLPVLSTPRLSGPSARLRVLLKGFDEVLAAPVDLVELEYQCRRLIQMRIDAKDFSDRNDRIESLLRVQEEMTSLVVHDMKGPLAAVMNNLEFLQSGETESTRVRALGDATVACRRLLRITVNLLDLVRIEEGRLQPSKDVVSIADILESILAFRRSTAARDGIELEVAVPSKVMVRFDLDLLVRVIENVLDNAVRYVPRGGRVRIWCATAEGRLALFIGNSGPPVPVDKREAIFEKFGTGGSAGRMSMGLGLFFCRLVVELHGGTIMVSERPDFPCVFVISLPQVLAPEQRAQPTSLGGPSA